MPETWEHAELVFIPAAACPACGNRGHDIVRSERQQYGTVRKVKCRGCGERFKIIVETSPLPETGSDDF
jgi:uncharacterized Zn finger protein